MVPEYITFACPVGEPFVLMNGEMIALRELSGQTCGCWFVGWASGREYPIFPAQDTPTITLWAEACAPWMPQRPDQEMTPV